MAHLDVYLNPDPETRPDVPFLLDIQNDVHLQLRTRMVVPLVRSEAQRVAIATLCPTLSIKGETVFASVPEMASYPARELSEKVVNLADRRGEIFAAIDFLFHGF